MGLFFRVLHYEEMETSFIICVIVSRQMIGSFNCESFPVFNLFSVGDSYLSSRMMLAFILFALFCRFLGLCASGVLDLVHYLCLSIVFGTSISLNFV